MPTRSEQFAPIIELTAELVNGSATREQIEQLETLLLASPEARRCYLDYIALHSDLSWDRETLEMLVESEQSRAMLLEAIEDIETSARRAQIEEGQRLLEEQAQERQLRLLIPEEPDLTPVRHIIIPKVVVYVAIGAMAALLILAVKPWLVAPPASESPWIVQEARASVAQITRSADAAWQAAGPTPRVGDRLHTESTLTLTRGFAQITFDRGAQLVLEAPTTLQLLSADRAMLLSGKVTGEVPAEAVGFTVLTPHGSVIDLGTHFGIETALNTGTSVHVFDGEVSLQPDPRFQTTNRQRIVAGEAHHLDQQGYTQPIESQPTRFLGTREIERLETEQQRSPIYRRWLEQVLRRQRDPSVVALYTFERDAKRPQLALEARLAHDPNAPDLHGRIPADVTWQTGRIPDKQALQLSGRSVIEFGPAIGQVLGHDVRQFTVALWARWRHAVPPHQGIFQIGVASDAQSELSLDLAEGQLIVTLGVPGARDPVFGHRLHTRGPTPAVDQWLHIVAVYDASLERDNLSLYVNGQRIATLTATGTLDFRGATMRVGTFVHPSGVNVHQPFDGFVDELMILRRALSAEEVRALYQDDPGVTH